MPDPAAISEFGLITWRAALDAGASSPAAGVAVLSGAIGGKRRRWEEAERAAVEICGAGRDRMPLTVGKVLRNARVFAAALAVEDAGGALLPGLVGAGVPWDPDAAVARFGRAAVTRVLYAAVAATVKVMGGNDPASLPFLAAHARD